ncbi:MAG TPA: 2Fe-2S iron-sulfur cluster-binding protein [Pyrinomonadaceae bacterium]|nr:2Fe-2S iron-sulfur cluster-binding protein [Pyrinomonadaceae bacterium]
MSVEIKFEPDGPSGLVAEGTSVVDAARRLGFQIPECGMCDGTCAIRIITGRTLLSDLTDTERQQLSPARLAAGERLACQCKAERGGELVIKLVSKSERTRTAEEKTRDLRKEFSELPFERKMATLIQLETIAMSQALDTIADRSVALGKMIFDTVLPNSGEPKHDQDQPSPEDKRV